MKIQKIILKDSEIIEQNGEYTQVFTNEKTYPAFLTNYSLKKGKEFGLIESSLFGDLLKMQGLEKLTNKNNQGVVNPDAFDSLDETKMLQMIYLAFVGANKNTNLSVDEFLEKYHYSLEQTMEIYMNLIMNLMESDPNKFAAGLNKSTNKSNKGKKYNRQR